MNIVPIVLSAEGIVCVNSYLLYDEVSKEAMIIDPGAEADRIYRYLQEYSLTLKYIAITHGHFDHIMAVAELKALTGALVCMCKEDEVCIRDSQWNAICMHHNHPPVNVFEIDRYIDDAAEIRMGSEGIRVLTIPGHTKGHVAFYVEGHLFCGDTILKGTVGLMGLPGSDADVLKKSITGKIFSLPDETILHCGHGEDSTVGYEKRNNNFVLSQNTPCQKPDD